MTKTLRSDPEVLKIEQRMNAAYLDARLRALKEPKKVEFGMPANQPWVGNVPAVEKVEPEPLIGRVARSHGDDQEFPLEYYIGPHKAKVYKHQVYSWAARIANTFFHPREGGHELTREVAAVRTFVVRGSGLSTLRRRESVIYRRAGSRSGNARRSTCRLLLRRRACRRLRPVQSRRIRTVLTIGRPLRSQSL